MKKENIYLKVDKDSIKEAEKILRDNHEIIQDLRVHNDYIFLVWDGYGWFVGSCSYDRTEINIQQFKELFLKSKEQLIHEFEKDMKEIGFNVEVIVKEMFEADDVVMCWDDGSNYREFIKYKELTDDWENIVKVTDEHVIKFIKTWMI